MREYGVIFAKYWQTTLNEGWSDDAKLLGAYLLSCSHGSIAGVFRLPGGYVCDDLGWNRERVAEAFRNCSMKGFVTVCETTQWVWIRKFLEWNSLDNPNQVKAAIKAVEQISSKCGWLVEFIDFFKPFAEPLGNPSRTASKRLHKPSLNQEQHQDQHQKKNPPNPPAGGLNGHSPARTRNPDRARKDASRSAWVTMEIARKANDAEGLRHKHPLIAETVRLLGGFHAIGMTRTDSMPQMRTRFREMYEQLLERESTHEPT